MKKLLIILISMMTIGISGCAPIGTPSNTNTPPTYTSQPPVSSDADGILSPVPSATTVADQDDKYIKIGCDLYRETMLGLFGKPASKEDNVASVDDIVEKLGQPTKINGRWHFKQGVEIDVTRLNDQYYELINYIYITPSSKLKTNRGIGIGSTKAAVLKAYADEINSSETDSKYIVAGRDCNGLIFEMKSDKVNSMFVGTGAFEEGGETYKR